jgi:hypothetical protein
MRKAIVGAFAVASVFASMSFAMAQDAKSSPPPNMDMMRGMNDHMGDMEKRMGGMHQMMQSCMANNNACSMDKMMTDMHAMHAQMTKMMADMESMHKGDAPMAMGKTPQKDKPDDHKQDHN